MAIQYSLTHRTNAMSQLNTDIGANAVIKIFSGTAPANCGTADSGTMLVTFAGNAGGFGTAASQVLTASAVASVTASNAGTAGYFRIYPSAATTTNAVVQGTVFASSTLVTSAATTANGNVLTFAAVSGVSVGQTVSGTGIPTGTTVIATTGTTVTLSQASTAGVSSGVTITFGGDMVVTNTSIASGQTCNFTSLTVTAFGV
jgi:hypothetical protein